MELQAEGGGDFLPKVLIKEGRCIKMLQISAASPAEFALPQVVRANILYLLCLFVSAYLRAPAAFTWLGEGRGAGLWQITIGAGAAEIKHFYLL